MNTALIVAPAALMTAVLATAGVFMCFSFAALLSPRRSYIFMGGKNEYGEMLANLILVLCCGWQLLIPADFRDADELSWSKLNFFSQMGP